VCDFGLARSDSTTFGTQTTTANVVGTAQWTAPEIFMGNDHTSASDV